MRKIPTLFARDSKNPSRVLPEVTPGCEWVLEGEGTPRRKYDGACCAIIDGTLYKRFTVKKNRDIPTKFLPEEFVDGKILGWALVSDGPEDKYFRVAFNALLAPLADDYSVPSKELIEGTYELVGPKINGNPEKFPCHVLVRHDTAMEMVDVPRTFDELREFMRDYPHEGIVWHHPDGRMAKIKRKDFGYASSL